MKGIPCAVMRGGTSKGAYFLASDLPAEPADRDRMLLRLLGGDARQADGLGGGDMLNSKVAVVSKSAEESVDVDYVFAQVVPGENRVDTAPTCGNILAGVGAFAIERGLVAASAEKTLVTVRDKNTGAKVEQIVQTPGGQVRYEGDCIIAGAPGSAAPVELFYLEFAGVKTGKLFPAGVRAEACGVAVTCIDAAMPLTIAAARDFGLSGRESPRDLQANAEFFKRMEEVRLEASVLMGLGDARGKVIPKFAVVAEPRDGGAISARYFTPVTAHAAFAVSGGIALACALLCEGTVAHEFARPPSPDGEGVHPVDIEHPSGMIKILMRMESGADGAPAPLKAGVIRTARMIMDGAAFPAAESA